MSKRTKTHIVHYYDLITRFRYKYENTVHGANEKAFSFYESSVLAL